MKNVLSIILFLVAWQCVAVGSEEAQETTSGDYDKLSWLVGKWEGEAFGGICEEIWEAESGGTMTGTFKLISGSKVSFYELMVIDLNREQPALILKHFNPDMTGWEEKDKVITFPILAVTDSVLSLAGMTYRNVAGDSLKITVITGHSDGTTSESVIECERVR